MEKSQGGQIRQNGCRCLFEVAPRGIACCWGNMFWRSAGYSLNLHDCIALLVRYPEKPLMGCPTAASAMLVVSTLRSKRLCTCVQITVLRLLVACTQLHLPLTSRGCCLSFCVGWAVRFVSILRARAQDLECVLVFDGNMFIMDRVSVIGVSYKTTRACTQVSNERFGRKAFLNVMSLHTQHGMVCLL